MADQLCTTAQVKARLQTSAGGVTFTAADDTLIGELIDQVTSFVQAYTGRKLVPEAGATYVFDTVYGSVLHIPRGIRVITSMGVAQTHQPDSGGTYVSIPAADRLLRPKAADLGNGWPYTQVQLTRGTLAGTVRYYATAENGCTITGDFGFATVPPDMQGVSIDATVAAFQSRKNGASGVIGAEDGALVPWSTFFSKGSPQRATLDRYRYLAI
jgi:hypothetical protein